MAETAAGAGTNALVTAAATPAPATAEHLCLKASLYEKFTFQKLPLHRARLGELRRSELQFDAYCIHCKRDSTFRTKRNGGSGSGYTSDPDWMFKKGQFFIEVFCGRVASHSYDFFFDFNADLELRKIGQWPSLEDIAGADLKRLRAVLTKENMAELSRATGLASHGIGIGSFVYIRRIFERLIDQHHQDLAEPIKDFHKKRMDEKVAALKGVLPPSLVQAKSMYGILSLGIHELDEETCSLYFPVVRSAIIRILEQDVQARNERAAEKQVMDDLAAIEAELARSRT